MTDRITAHDRIERWRQRGRAVRAWLGSLLVLVRLWRRMPPADKAKLWSAWQGVSPDLADHTERVVAESLSRWIGVRIALVELAAIDDPPAPPKP